MINVIISICSFLLIIFVFSVKTLYSNTINEGKYYFGFNIGSFEIYRINKPGDFEDGLAVGFESGVILNDHLLLGFHIYTGASGYVDDKVGVEYKTITSMTEAHLYISYFPISSNNTVPDRIYFRPGIGWARFDYKTDIQEYKEYYDSVTPNHSASFLLGLGYAFTMESCLSSASFNIGIDFSYQKYLTNKSLNDTYLYRFYFAGIVYI